VDARGAFAGHLVVGHVFASLSLEAMSSLAPSFDKGGAGAPMVAGTSAISWPAVIAGAFVAAGVSLILLALGSGLGFASVSPWRGHGVSAGTFTVMTAIWLLIIQWVSAGMGGYVAGRLRSRWLGTHVHEVFFRDTAHGLVTWAVGSVLTVALLASSLSALAGEAAPAVKSRFNADYTVDRLLRPSADAVATGAAAGANPSAGVHDEAVRIVANAVMQGAVPDVDRSYLAFLVAEEAGVPPAEAQRRVDDFITAFNADEAQAKSAADAARKGAAEASLYLALSLLMGAFIASVAAALGGRERDAHG